MLNLLVHHVTARFKRLKDTIYGVVQINLITNYDQYSTDSDMHKNMSTVLGKVGFVAEYDDPNLKNLHKFREIRYGIKKKRHAGE
jgi:hypothetical protein